MEENPITNLLNNYEDGNELEIRVGYFKNGRFNSKITENMFAYFFEYFNKKELKLNLTYSSSRIYMYRPGLPHGKIKTIETPSDEVTIQKKVKNIIDLQKNNMRIALSKETVIPTLPVYKENSIFKRRGRFTFYNDTYNFKIDLTQDMYEDKYLIIQLEVEFIKKPRLEEIYGVLNWLKKGISKYYEIQDKRLINYRT